MIKALTMNIQESYQPMLPLSPQKGPDSSLEISPNKKRSIPGNDYGVKCSCAFPLIHRRVLLGVRTA